MPDHWGFVAAAYGLTAVVLFLYWRRLGKKERQVHALQQSGAPRNRERLTERSHEPSGTGHPRPEPGSRTPLP